MARDCELWKAATLVAEGNDERNSEGVCCLERSCAALKAGTEDEDEAAVEQTRGAARAWRRI